jgi:polyhydroxyalkanoate synthesis regulator phasin
VRAVTKSGLVNKSGLDRFIESRIEEILNRVNIPSRSDIERLHRSVDLLTAKVEALLNKEPTARPPRRTRG